MTTWKLLLAGAALATSSLVCHAGTVDDAKAMVDAAIAATKSKGVDAAIKEFNAGGAWRKNGLYIVAVKFDGTMLAHSSNEKMIGKNLFEAKDAAGKLFVQENIANVKASGASQVDLRWPNPDTKQIGDAVMISKRVPGADAYVGSVAFK
jgi:cytochrome c